MTLRAREASSRTVLARLAAAAGLLLGAHVSADTLGVSMANFDDRWLANLREAMQARAKEINVRIQFQDAQEDIGKQLSQIQIVATHIRQDPAITRVKRRERFHWPCVGCSVADVHRAQIPKPTITDGALRYSHAREPAPDHVNHQQALPFIGQGGKLLALFTAQRQRFFA